MHLSQACPVCSLVLLSIMPDAGSILTSFFRSKVPCVPVFSPQLLHSLRSTFPLQRSQSAAVHILSSTVEALRLDHARFWGLARWGHDPFPGGSFCSAPATVISFQFLFRVLHVRVISTVCQCAVVPQMRHSSTVWSPVDPSPVALRL